MDIPSWFWVLLGVLDVVIVLENGLLIGAIATRRRLHNSSNWFILSLAVAHFLVGAVSIPLTMICRLAASCDTTLRLLFAELMMYLSIGNVCVLTVDRYTAITRPLRYPTFMTNSRVFTFIFLAWFLPLVAGLSQFAWIFSRSSHTAAHIFRAVQLTAFEVTPCVVVLLVHCKIFKIYRNHRRQISLQRKQMCSNRQLNQGRFCTRRGFDRSPFSSSLKAFAVVVVVFVVCWLLSTTLTVCVQYEICGVPNALYVVSLLLVYANPAFNATVLLLFKKDIRNEVRRILRFRRQRRLDIRWSGAVGRITVCQVTKKKF